MKKIKLALEYKTFPVWLYDEYGSLINNDSPEELRGNKDLEDKLVGLQNEYV